MTVHGELALDASEVAVHCSDETSRGVTSEIEVVPEEAPIAAVKVADWSEAIAPAVAVKVAVAALAGTVTVAGTVRPGRLLESVTAVPPVAAA